MNLFYRFIIVWLLLTAIAAVLAYAAFSKIDPSGCLSMFGGFIAGIASWPVAITWHKQVNRHRFL